jgi:hypothetical protein
MAPLYTKGAAMGNLCSTNASPLEQRGRVLTLIKAGLALYGGAGAV